MSWGGLRSIHWIVAGCHPLKHEDTSEIKEDICSDNKVVSVAE